MLGFSLIVRLRKVILYSRIIRGNVTYAYELIIKSLLVSTINEVQDEGGLLIIYRFCSRGYV